MMVWFLIGFVTILVWPYALVWLIGFVILLGASQYAEQKHREDFILKVIEKRETR
jgi:hypothetical protein